MSAVAQLALAVLLWAGLAPWGAHVLRGLLCAREAAADLPPDTPTRIARQPPWLGLAAWLASALAAGVLLAVLPAMLPAIPAEPSTVLRVTDPPR